MPSHGFSLTFTPGPKESNQKVSHQALKINIFGPSIVILPRILKLIFSPDPAKPVSLKVETYSLVLFKKMLLRGFSLMFTPGQKESKQKVSHEELKLIEEFNTLR